jgi:hypothetical protein
MAIISATNTDAYVKCVSSASHRGGTKTANDGAGYSRSTSVTGVPCNRSPSWFP